MIDIKTRHDVAIIISIPRINFAYNTVPSEESLPHLLVLGLASMFITVLSDNDFDISVATAYSIL